MRLEMTPTPPPRASLAAWAGLALLTVPVFMVAIDMTVLFLATPTIAAALEPTATQQLWMLHIGDLVGAGLVLTAGRLVDRFGPRRLLVISALAYGSANLLAAYAPSIEYLIAARALIGFSAISMIPAGMALLRRMFTSDAQFSRAVAIFMSAFSGGVAFGPPIGGALLENFWWGSIFLLNVPIAFLVALLAPTLPKVPGSGVGRIDMVSVLLSLTAVALVVYGGQELASRNVGPPQVAAVAVGLVAGLLFIRRQLRLTTPLLDPALFASRSFTVGLVAILLVILATAGADMQFAQYLQVGLGHSPFTAGMLLIIPATLSIVATVLAPSFLRWVRPSAVMGTGVLIAAGGALLMAVLLQGEASVAPALAAVSIIAAGAAPVFALGAVIIVNSAPAAQTGSASASTDVAGSLGNTIGLATGGTIAFVSYQSRLGGTLPAGLDEATRELSLQSIGSALATARSLPDELGVPLHAAAIDAFAVATRNTYAFATLGLAVLAAVILWGLRHARIDSDPGVDEVGSENPPSGHDESGDEGRALPEDTPVPQAPTATGPARAE
ncbi:MFS transporter [Pseudactinotalea sp. Z1732]|uniref:MFS transporter n=1 Tax=Micrococcales TaxID=85006 RepID=UPI003C7B0851